MTKENYEAIAGLVKEFTEIDGLLKARFLANALAQYFHSIDPEFDTSEFYETCLRD